MVIKDFVWAEVAKEGGPFVIEMLFKKPLQMAL